MSTAISRRQLLAAMPALTVPAANGGVKLGCHTNAWKATIQDFATLMPVLKRIKDFAFDGFETSFRYVQDRFTDARGQGRS